MKERKKIDAASLILCGGFLMLGSFLTISSFDLPSGTAGYPGAGFFPRALGITILMLSVFLALQSLHGRMITEFRMNHSRVVAGVGALTLAYLLSWGAGLFALRTFVFVLLLLRFLDQSWKTSVIVSAVLTGSVTLAFQFGLNLSLD